jgi:3-deoxy-D-manno-octulosonic-acid transferase
LGAREEQLRVTGNLKYDYALPPTASEIEWLDAMRARLGRESANCVIVMGSTMKGEEAGLLEAFRKVRSAVPQARLILAPRHPERFDEVADLLKQSGLRFLRRSQMNANTEAVDIILLDSMGELRTVYSLAAVAVVGGSFLPYGGHNPLEAAALGKAVIFGPHMSNFQEMSDLFVREMAACRCSLEDLPPVLIDLLGNADARRSLGDRALITLNRNQGAALATLDMLLSSIS